MSERNRAFSELDTGDANANEMLQQLLVSSNACSAIRCDCDTSVNASTETDSTTPPVTLVDENANNEIGADVDALSSTASSSRVKVIYIITPTYTRPTQMADMTRLAQTLMLVKDIFWIVVEDATELNAQVSDLLNRTNLPNVHLLGPRPVRALSQHHNGCVSRPFQVLTFSKSHFVGHAQRQAQRPRRV